MRFLFTLIAASLLTSVGRAELIVFPATLTIRGADDAPHLIVDSASKSGRTVDVTATVKFSVVDVKICRIDDSGRVFPLANGNTEITAKVNGETIKVPVTVTMMDSPRPINFTNTIEPILTKLGCNAGGCHGKIQGQNGFRLSLLGFDSELDYTTLVKEGRGRRLLPAAPDASLFLLKATGQMPHGGGRKMDPASEEYKIVRRWIATGMPFGLPGDPAVTKVTVTPSMRVLDRGAKQQLVVQAHYSDGTVEDVTRRAQFESNQTDVATINEAGLLQTAKQTGQAGVMIRFQGAVTVFRGVVPRTGDMPTFDFAAKTNVDTHTAAKWRELGLTPSKPCTDEEFLRRASLDITGTLPLPAEIMAFAADKDAGKRDKLIDRLVETPEFAYYFANKWADVLRVKRRGQSSRAAGTFAFHTWIRDAIAADMPYDQFVREIITAIGEETNAPTTVWYKEITTPEQFVDDVSQVFLGQRMACANCHHHPYEKWTQDDYWSMAAFYGRVGSKTLPSPGISNNGQQTRRQAVFIKANGSVTNKRTGKTAEHRPLDGETVKVAAEDDPRKVLADWMTDANNPYFARTVANRYWAHFFGRGIVDPIDDMRVTNPPSNPELLDALTADLVANKFSLKSLVKTIAKSRTYGLSSEPNEFNQSDKQSFARYYPKRLSAEVIFDAVCKVTDSPSLFPGLPTDRNAPQRAIMLPDESFSSYFLDVTGRPQRISACECERVNEASLAMTLHLLNSQEVQDKIGRAGSRVDQLSKDKRPDAEKVAELFLLVLSQSPTAEQMKTAMDHLAKHEKDRKTGYENILWALINSKAFIFNR